MEQEEQAALAARIRKEYQEKVRARVQGGHQEKVREQIRKEQGKAGAPEISSVTGRGIPDEIYCSGKWKRWSR